MEKYLLSFLNKKLIISILTSSVFITGCTTSVIWLYLSNINRLDVFFDAVNLSSSLGIIFVFILLSLIGFSTLIFMASFVLVAIYTANERVFKEYNGIANRIGLVCYVNSLFVFAVLIIGFSIKFFFEIKNAWVFVSGCVCILFFGYYITNKMIINSHAFFVQDIGRVVHHIRKKRIRFFLPLFLIAPGVFQLLPIMFLITRLEFQSNVNECIQMILFILICLAFITLGVLPGSILINERENKSDAIKVLCASVIFIVVALLSLGFLFRPIPGIIINMTMTLSGISDWREHQYYLDTDKYSHRMFNGRIWNTRYYNDLPGRFFITGINIFSLGNVKLICPTRISEVSRNSLKDSPLGINEYNDKIDVLRKTALLCIPFQKDEIHPWDSPITEPVFYEKIKNISDNSMIKILDGLK